MSVNYNILNKIYEKCNSKCNPKIYCYMYFPSYLNIVNISEVDISPKFVEANNKEEAHVKIFKNYCDIREDWIHYNFDIIHDKYYDNLINFLMKNKSRVSDYLRVNCYNYRYNLNIDIYDSDQIYKILKSSKKIILREIMVRWVNIYNIEYREIKELIPDKNELNKLISKYIKLHIYMLNETLKRLIDDEKLEYSVIIFFDNVKKNLI